MSEENRPGGIFFGAKYAWNFAQEAIDEGIAQKPRASSTEDDILRKGIERNWITQQNREKALQMFVFGNQIFLPLEVRLLFKGQSLQSGHIASYFEENPHLKDVKSQLWEEIFTKPDKQIKDRINEIVSRNFNERTGYRITPADIETAKKEAAYYGEHFRWSKPFAMMPLEFYEMAQIEESILTQSMTAAVLGVPILDDVGEQDIKQKTLGYFSRNETVSIYFRNFIQVPQPFTLTDAFRMRENRNIVEWRTIISRLSEDLAQGKIDEREVIKSVREGNEIIQGTKDIQSIGSPLISFLIAASDFATDLVPALKAAKIAVKVGSAVSTYLQLHGWIAQKAIESGIDEKYRWLFICN